MPYTNYLDQKLSQLFLGNTAYPIPANLYLGLSSTAPSQVQAGTPTWNFTEPAGNAYARVMVPNNATNFGPVTPALSNGFAMKNLLVVTFLQASGPWLAGAPLSYFGLFDTLTAGNLCLYGTCSPAQTVGSGNITLSFAAGALNITLN
jgi:hypothetical protein